MKRTKTSRDKYTLVILNHPEFGHFQRDFTTAEEMWAFLDVEQEKFEVELSWSAEAPDAKSGTVTK